MIGVDISSRSIKVVEVTGGSAPTLRTLCWAPLASDAMTGGVIQDVPAVAEALAKTLAGCSSMNLESNSVVASIPEAQSFVRVLELPVMAENELDEAVRWAVRRHIPFDLDRVYVDWQLLPSPRGQTHYQVLVGAAQRAVVDPLLQVLDLLKLKVVALELEAQAVLRCLLPQAASDVHTIAGVLVVDLGATSTNVVFFDQGAMRYTASLQVGGDSLSQRLAEALTLGPREAMELKVRLDLDGGAKDEATQIVRAGATELAEKVARTAQEMSVQLPAGRVLKAILLSGGGANLKGIRTVFTSAFPDAAVMLGNPWTNLNRGSRGRRLNVSTADALHFTTALGLALRPAEQPY